MKHIVILFSLFVIGQFQVANADDTSLDGAFSTPGGMTDEQVKESKEFMHEGARQEYLDKACKDSKDSKNCNQDPNAAGTVLNGTLGQAIENNIGMIYGLIFGGTSFLSGKMPSVNVVNKGTDLSGLEGKDKRVAKKKESQEKFDYCMTGAIGYELVAKFMQTSEQDKIQKKVTTDPALQNDVTLQSLTALKLTHEARKKTSTYQAGIYTATSACYIARAATSKGRVVLDAKYWAKMAGSGALATLYWLKVKKHKKAAEAVQTVIAGLPGAGKCNPWTDTGCFCSQPSSQTLYADTYQEICVLNGGDGSTPKTAMGCGVLVNGEMTFDEKCECKKTNTCYKARITATKFGFGMGSNFMNQANQGYDLLSDGNFDTGKFDSYYLQAGANASKVKNKISPVPAIKSKPLTTEQKKKADGFKGLLPPSVAGLAAQATPIFPGGASTAGIDNAIAKLPKNIKDKVEAIEGPKYSKSGGGYNEEAAEEGFAMPAMGGEAGPQGGTEVLTFAEKAIMKAEITDEPSKPIFDIISDRYKRSATHLNH